MLEAVLEVAVIVLVDFGMDDEGMVEFRFPHERGVPFERERRRAISGVRGGDALGAHRNV